MRTKLEQAAYEYRVAVREVEKALAEQRERYISAFSLVGEKDRALTERLQRLINSCVFEGDWQYTETKEASEKLLEAALKEQD